MTQETTSSIAGPPPYLRPVADFMNTLDVESGGDDIATPDALAAWLRKRDVRLDPATVTGGDFERAVRLRTALRALAFANHDKSADAHALEDLNSLAATLPLAVRFEAHGEAALAPTAEGVDGVLAAIVAGVYRAMLEGTWPRLKICAADTCQWAFYDRSKNRSGTWCSMAVCGNRTKVRKYQQRKRGTDS